MGYTCRWLIGRWLVSELRRRRPIVIGTPTGNPTQEIQWYRFQPHSVTPTLDLGPHCWKLEPIAHLAVRCLVMT